MKGKSPEAQFCKSPVASYVKTRDSTNDLKSFLKGNSYFHDRDVTTGKFRIDLDYMVDTDRVKVSENLADATKVVLVAPVVTFLSCTGVFTKYVSFQS